MTNQSNGGFSRTLFVDLAFEAADLDAVRVAIRGASDGEPVEGAHVLPKAWQVVLGTNGGPDATEFTLAEASVGGDDQDFLPGLVEHLGEIPNNFGPGDSVGDLCGGF